MDSNYDGILSREELINGFSHVYGPQDVLGEVDFVMSKLDINGYGQLDYSGNFSQS